MLGKGFLLYQEKRELFRLHFSNNNKVQPSVMYFQLLQESLIPIYLNYFLNEDLQYVR